MPTARAASSSRTLAWTGPYANQLLHRLGEIDPKLNHSRSIGRAFRTLLDIRQGKDKPTLARNARLRFSNENAVDLDDAQAGRVLDVIRDLYQRAGTASRRQPGSVGTAGGRSALVLARGQKPIHLSCLSAPGGPRPWKVRPSWYQVSTEDHTIAPALQLRMAERVGPRETLLERRPYVIGLSSCRHREHDHPGCAGSGSRRSASRAMYSSAEATGSSNEAPVNCSILRSRSRTVLGWQNNRLPMSTVDPLAA